MVADCLGCSIWYRRGFIDVIERIFVGMEVFCVFYYSKLAPAAKWRAYVRRVGGGCQKRNPVKDLSHCLQLEDGELPLELLPELQELRTFGSGDTGDALTSFIDARRNTGRPVTLIRE